MNGLLNPDLVGIQSGCLTIATRTILRKKNGQPRVEVNCSKCGEVSFADYHKIVRRAARGCSLCMNRFGEHCPEWLYRRVQHQWRRCNIQSHRNYHSYGGRGIEFRFASVYEGACWIAANLGLPGDRKLTIDRVNNDGHYEPGNLRWATSAEQSNNQRKRLGTAKYNPFMENHPEIGYSRGYAMALHLSGLTFQEIADRWKMKENGTLNRTRVRKDIKRIEFQEKYPHVKFSRTHLNRLLRRETHEEVLEKWDRYVIRMKSKSGISSTLGQETDLPRPDAS